MTTDHQHGRRIVCCDGCGDSVEDDSRTAFEVFWAALKAEGWKAFKDGDEWSHLCPACAGNK
jgi:hypothetical protein